MLRLGGFVVARPPAAVEDRHVQDRRPCPGAARAVDDTQQVAGLNAAAGGEIDAGIERGLGDADARIGGDQLCSAARRSGRRSSRAEGRPAGTCGRLRLIDEALPRVTGPGLSAQQEVDQIFGLFLRFLEQGRVGLGGGDQGLGLVDFQHAGDAALHAGVDQPDGLLAGR